MKKVSPRGPVDKPVSKDGHIFDIISVEGIRLKGHSPVPAAEPVLSSEAEKEERILKSVEQFLSKSIGAADPSLIRGSNEQSDDAETVKPKDLASTNPKRNVDKYALYMQLHENMGLDDERAAKKFAKCLMEASELASARPELIHTHGAREIFQKLARCFSDDQKSPAQWANKRARRGRTAPEFLAEEYSGRIHTQTLTKAQLLSADRPLYLAVAQWASRQLRSGNNAIPKALRYLLEEDRSQRVEAELERYGIVEPADAYRIIKGDPRLRDRLAKAAALRVKQRAKANQKGTNRIL